MHLILGSNLNRKKTLNLVRDLIQICRIYIDDVRIFSFKHKDRFNYSKSVNANKINVRILGSFHKPLVLPKLVKNTQKAIHIRNQDFCNANTLQGKHRGDEKYISVEKSRLAEKMKLEYFILMVITLSD